MKTEINLFTDFLVHPVSEYPKWKVIVNTLAFDTLDEAMEYMKELGDKLKQAGVKIV